MVAHLESISKRSPHVKCNAMKDESSMKQMNMRTLLGAICTCRYA